MIAIELPWPARSLHPNARVHWAMKARATKASRNYAGWAAKEAGIRAGDFDIPQALKVTVAFAAPSKRRVDEDGVLSSCKAYLDGISDAIGIDDSRFQIAIRRDAPVRGGSVRIELEAA